MISLAQGQDKGVIDKPGAGGSGDEVRTSRHMSRSLTENDNTLRQQYRVTNVRRLQKGSFRSLQKPSMRNPSGSVTKCLTSVNDPARC